MNSKKLDRYFAKKLTDYVEQYIRAVKDYDVRIAKTKDKYSIEIKPRTLVDRFYRPVFNVSFEDAAIRTCNVDAVIKRVKECIREWEKRDWSRL